MQMREKVGKSRNTVFFPMICGSGGSKSRLAKAAGAEPAGQMSDEKLHAVVARSTFRSQNVQNTSASDHFWKLRCRKSARHRGIFSCKFPCQATFAKCSLAFRQCVLASNVCPRPGRNLGRGVFPVNVSTGLRKMCALGATWPAPFFP